MFSLVSTNKTPIMGFTGLPTARFTGSIIWEVLCPYAIFLLLRAIFFIRLCPHGQPSNQES